MLPSPATMAQQYLPKNHEDRNFCNAFPLAFCCEVLGSVPGVAPKSGPTWPSSYPCGNCFKPQGSLNPLLRWFRVGQGWVWHAGLRNGASVSAW